jgi:ATP-dependent Clp protease ATP-binding subunit ClpA
MNHDSLETLTDWEALRERDSQGHSRKSRAIDVDDMTLKLKRSVKGQDHVIDDLVRGLWQSWAMEKRTSPVFSALFVGPHGVGKTQMALAIAEYLYQAPESLLELNFNEYKTPESLSRLIGIARGYRDSEKGGTLTGPMITDRRRVVLLDEFDKAYHAVFDILMSMLDKGWITEAGSERRVDFTESVVILTSNAEQQALGELMAATPDVKTLSHKAKEHLHARAGIRAEILDRLNMVYVFKRLDRMTSAKVVGLKMIQIADNYGLALVSVDHRLIAEALAATELREGYSARELDRIVQGLMGPLFIHAKRAGYREIRVAGHGRALEVEPVSTQQLAEGSPQ